MARAQRAYNIYRPLPKYLQYFFLPD